MADTPAGHRHQPGSPREFLHVFFDCFPDEKNLAAAKGAEVVNPSRRTESFKRLRMVRASYFMRVASSSVVRYV